MRVKTIERNKLENDLVYQLIGRSLLTLELGFNTVTLPVTELLKIEALNYTETLDIKPISCNELEWGVRYLCR